jgi:Kef-type K+ transport system membrane component KefB
MEQATSLVVIALAVFVLPLAAGRLRLPAVVAEIVFGILVGPSALNLIQGSELLDLLADLGLFLLMFLSGFEIDFGKLERQRLSAIGTGMLVFALTLLGSHFVTGFLGYGFFMTLVLSTTSVGLVVPTLRSTRHTGTRLGQAVLISAILADFLTLMAVAFLALVHEHGVSWDLLKFPALFLAIIVVLRCLRLAVWWHPKQFARLFSSDDPEELGIRVSLAFMLAFVGLSMALDIEPILGAFLAGMVFALVFRSRGALEHRLSGFSYGFLIPIFFINIGIRFELESLMDSESFLRAVLIVVAAFAVKILPSFAHFIQGMELREILAAGTLLSARLSLIIAVATVGVELGLLTVEDRALAILIATVTTTLAPSLFRIIAPSPTGWLPFDKT